MAFLLLKESFKPLFAEFGTQSYPQIALQRQDTEKPSLKQIIQHNSFRVVVEGVTVGTTCCVLDALTLTFAAYYVFNLQYADKMKAFYTFLQKGVCKMHNNCIHINKVVELITEVNVML